MDERAQNSKTTRLLQSFCFFVYGLKYFYSELKCVHNNMTAHVYKNPSFFYTTHFVTNISFVSDSQYNPKYIQFKN